MTKPDDIDWAQIDWDNLYPHVVSIAHGKLQRLSWRGRRGGAKRCDQNAISQHNRYGS
jgi:hypothetical protein